MGGDRHKWGKQQPASPQAAFDLEQHLQNEIRELARVGLEWAYNHVEATALADLPTHVEFQATLYTRGFRKTPQTVTTTFGKIRLWRQGYRPTHKTGEPTLFPLAVQLGLVAGPAPPWRNGRPSTRPKPGPRSGERCNGSSRYTTWTGA